MLDGLESVLVYGISEYNNENNEAITVSYASIYTRT
jgi:hypothetical protein